jgi:uncharacterized lipoprotein YddW (UPF0748 family)
MNHLKNHLRLVLLCLIAFLTVLPVAARRKQVDEVPDRKTEFRGVWIQTAFQERYQKMTPAECQAYLTRLVDELSQTGFNAILFQVRPEGDAFYRSDLEPWSRFLTGRQGKAPVPEWDPMEFLINLCHERQMEFHAWLNPYRMSATKTLTMAPDHLYFKRPDLFVRYQDKLYLNPGLPESRAHIREVVKDIVRRYDIDAIHLDDYFYPYPSDTPFDDRAAYLTYADLMGFNSQSTDDLAAWRRRNVNILIKSLSADIKSLKPWVRFGISPFGIYRNSTAWRGGSKTRGTQCYSDLYADVLLWCNSGWIDYVIPQIYWEVGHALADYTTLVKWWNANVPPTCHLYIGQSIERSLDEPRDSRPQPDLRKSHAHFSKKLNLAQECRNVRGNCFWYGYQVDDNAYHVRDLLRDEIFKLPALPPAFTSIDAEAPDKVRQLSATLTGRGLRLSWSRRQTSDPQQQERYYCVYKFRKGERVDTSDLSHLLTRTARTELMDYDLEGSRHITYVVTAVDACNNESKPVKKTVKVKIK